MIVPVFVDTNVLVYARDSSEQAKQERARAGSGTPGRRPKVESAFRCFRSTT